MASGSAVSSARRHETQGYAPVDRGHLFYERTVEGRPVVFVHAGIADRTMWRPQIAAFGDSCDVVTFDSRGYGLSLSDPVEFSPVEDLRALLDHLEIERPVLVGCSRGGGHCLDLAVEYPERVAAVVWICGSLSGLDFPASAEEEDRFALMQEAYKTRDWSAVAELETRVWLDGALAREGRVGPPVRTAVRAMIQRVRSRPEDNVTVIPPSRMATAHLHLITCPVLLIVGELDTPYVHQAADLLNSGLQSVERFDFPDSAHLPNVEHPERFNGALADFLDRVAA